MRRLFPRPNDQLASTEANAALHDPLEDAARPAKAIPELPLCFMFSHVDPDGPVRLDGVKLSLTELMGLERDAPKLGAFAGLLNACDFPLQFLVRRHPPDLERLRRELEESQLGDLPEQTREPAHSQRRLLTELESREGILDRRFYAVCEEEHARELRGLLARSGLSIHPLEGETLQRLVIASALGGSPARSGRAETVEVTLPRKATANREVWF